MNGLTEQQEKALELDKHISLTANAGSGKTRVLVERYVSAVREGVPVEQILCLTFTDKAALELRQKISERISSEYRVARATGGEAGEALSKARAGMLEANINTIHSFCSQILREFPVETGIDANFKVLEEFDASSLKEDACVDAIRESLSIQRREGGDGAQGKSVRDLLLRGGYRKVLKLMTGLLDNREKIEYLRIAGKSMVPDEELVKVHWFNLVRGVADVVTSNVKKKKGDFTTDAEDLCELTADARAQLSPALAGLKALLNEVLTAKGEIRKKGIEFGSSAKYTEEEAEAVLKMAFDSLKDLPENFPDDSSYFRLLQAVAELYLKSEEKYARRKFLMGALDFDDLQISTLHLLQTKESVARTLAARFRHIMVDEFQDTNFLQYEILLNLLDNFSSEARLFLVGDSKQSIYRFRNAQVEVSQVASDQLSAFENGRSLALSESFRMNRDIAGFVNDVFGNVLKGNRIAGIAGLPSMNQTVYNPLEARRPNGVPEAVEIYLKEKRTPGESMEGAADEEIEESSTEEQALFTAARIREMVASAEKIKSARSGEEERTIGYGDVAILLRTRTNIQVIEKALTAYGIPYVVSAGTGFYSAQEVFDLTNYLAFLLDNTSDLALLAVLRSPLFGLSDNELFQVSLAAGETFYERFRSFANSGDAADDVKYAAAVLDEETQLAQRETIPHLINRILERTGWLGAYGMSPTAPQRLANMRKLLGIAREFEGRGFTSLFDFVERIKYLKEEAREGQAPIEESADAVKVMTVHAAKGLEFPVVCIPLCDAPSKRDTGTLISNEVGIVPFVGTDVPPALRLYSQLEKLNAQAEVSRLFYVASTRAMDRLILTTKVKKSASGINSFTDVLLQSLPLSSPPEGGYFDLPSGKVKVHSAIPKAEPDVRRKAEKHAELGEIFLDEIPADIDGEIYSATLLQTFMLCPTKYFLRYRLGMPDQIEEERGGKPQLPAKNAAPVYEDYDDTILSTQKGQMVHSALEHLINANASDEESVMSVVRKTVGAMAGGEIGGDILRELIETIAMNVRNALGTLSGLAGNGKKYTEQTITRRFKSDFLTGTLDLLTEDESGFHIFDYKTNKLTKSDQEIYSGYEVQMKLYALLCGNLKAEQTRFDVTIILTREPGRYVRMVYSREDLMRFENEVGSMLESIKGLDSGNGLMPPSESLPTSSPHCGECEYFVGQGRKECLMKRSARRP